MFVNLITNKSAEIIILLVLNYPYCQLLNEYRQGSTICSTLWLLICDSKWILVNVFYISEIYEVLKTRVHVLLAKTVPLNLRESLMVQNVACILA